MCGRMPSAILVVGQCTPTSLSWLQLPWPHPPLQGAVHLQEESILLQDFYLSFLLVPRGGPVGWALWWWCTVTTWGLLQWEFRLQQSA